MLLVFCHILPLRMRCSDTCSARLQLLRLLCTLLGLHSGCTCCLAAAVRCHHIWCTLILRRHLYCSIGIVVPAICIVSCSGCGTRILISHARAHADLVHGLEPAARNLRAVGCCWHRMSKLALDCAVVTALRSHCCMAVACLLQETDVSAPSEELYRTHHRRDCKRSDAV
jgi:hypothetical protein